jgi:hypothetical protein
LLKYTLGVPPRAAKLIESLQPYHRADPSTHLLSQLNRLGNIDKHRRIPVHGDEVIFNLPKMPRTLVVALKFDHEQHLVSAPLELKDQMEVAPMASFKVIFGDYAEGVSCDFRGGGSKASTNSWPIASCHDLDASLSSRAVQYRGNTLGIARLDELQARPIVVSAM